MSSGLQFSSPKPVTKTSSHDSAACASGAAASFSAAALAAAAVEALLAPPAAADAPESEAPILLICAGTPVAVPPKLMLLMPTTEAAAMLMLPAAPIPASPALTVPTGAIKSTLPGGVLDSVWMVRMPLPAAAPEKLIETVPSLLINTDGGGAETAVLAPRPASMLPSSDQIRILPPPRVNIRDALTLTSPCE